MRDTMSLRAVRPVNSPRAFCALSISVRITSGVIPPFSRRTDSCLRPTDGFRLPRVGHKGAACGGFRVEKLLNRLFQLLHALAAVSGEPHGLHTVKFAVVHRTKVCLCQHRDAALAASGVGTQGQI